MPYAYAVFSNNPHVIVHLKGLISPNPYVALTGRQVARLWYVDLTSSSYHKGTSYCCLEGQWRVHLVKGNSEFYSAKWWDWFR